MEGTEMIGPVTKALDRMGSVAEERREEAIMAIVEGIVDARLTIEHYEKVLEDIAKNPKYEIPRFHSLGGIEEVMQYESSSYRRTRLRELFLGKPDANDQGL